MGLNYKDLTISIVLYNNSVKEITTLLSSLGDVNCQIIIIDNSPTNALSSVVKPYKFVRYIFNNENLGYGKAHNIAIQTSIDNCVKYHLVLNPDIELNTSILEELKYYMDNHTDVGLCMPNIVYPNLERQYLCKLLPTPFDLFFRRFTPTKKMRENHSERYELQGVDYTIDFESPSLSGCFMFMRTEILERVGVFDKRFFMYCEDLDLCRRINAYSRTMYVPTAPVIHHYNKQSYRSKKLLLYHLTSTVLYFNKWGWIFDKKRKEINKKTLKALKID
jgi:GT2 family glycosyltransferase